LGILCDVAYSRRSRSTTSFRLKTKLLMLRRIVVGMYAGFPSRNTTETKSQIVETRQLRNRVNFWVYGVALKTAPCILLTVLSALLIRAMRAAEIRHRRLVQRRPVLSSFSASPRIDARMCTVRRHHTFEEPKNSSQPDLNGDTLGESPAAWKRSFSERRPTIGEAINLRKITYRADELQDNPDKCQTYI